MSRVASRRAIKETVEAMKISSVTIKNHGRFPDCTLDVRENLILVGPNGSGKSSFIRCLDLLLGKTTQQLYYNIHSSDFEDTERPLSIEAKITNLTKDELSFFPDEVDVSDESLTVRLEATLDGEDLTINRYFPKGAGNGTLTSAQLKSIGWSMIPSNFSTKSLSSGRNTIVDDYLKKIDASGDEAEIANAISSLCSAIDSSSAFDGALSSLASQLDPALEGGMAVANLRFVPGAAIDGNLLSDIRLQIKSKSGVMREATEQSDGTKALISFTIFGLLNSGGIIAIDEPETHLHPSAQRNLMHILQNSGRQLVVATHSGVVAGEFNPDNIVVTREGSVPKQPNRGFLQKDQKTLARWWISSRIELLTARHIIAVEGQSDRMVLERVAELTGCRLERDGVEILEAGGCGEMPHIMSIFGENGFGAQVSILIDEDAEEDTASALDIATKDLASKSIYVSRKDLEDEYVSAIEAIELWKELRKSSLFTPNMLNTCNIANGASAPGEIELADFCRRKKNKIACAVVACGLLKNASAQKVSSVVEVLQNAIR